MAVLKATMNLLLRRLGLAERRLAAAATKVSAATEEVRRRRIRFDVLDRARAGLNGLDDAQSGQIDAR
jgi:hypothetical protein